MKLSSPRLPKQPQSSDVRDKQRQQWVCHCPCAGCEVCRPMAVGEGSWIVPRVNSDPKLFTSTAENVTRLLPVSTEVAVVTVDQALLESVRLSST